MMADASTPPAAQAKMTAAASPIEPGAGEQTMARIFLIVVTAGLVLIGVAVVYLGTFPPNPTPHPVEKVLPNEKFQTN
jgi:hypothetical protein